MAADQVKLRKRLEVLLKLPENQVCVDCRKRGPRWASANLGVFMCIECSGIHRNLGVHISFVRSVNLDSWTVKQVEFMEEWGNARSNEYFEANIPTNVMRPKEGDSVRTVEKFIRDKYEYRRWIAKEIPKRRDADAAVEQVPAAVLPNKRSNAVATVESAKLAASFAAPLPKAENVNQPSLIDFMDDPVPPPQPVQHHVAVFDPFAPQPQAPQQPAFGGAAVIGTGFSSFDETPTHFQSHSSNNDWNLLSVSAGLPQQQQQHSFDSNQQQHLSQQHLQHVPPAPPAKPQVSADSILSLYGGHGQQQQQQQQQNIGNGTLAGGQPGFAPTNGMHYGGPFSAQHQPYMQPMQHHPLGGGAPMGGGMMGGGMMMSGGGMGAAAPPHPMHAPVNPFAPTMSGGGMSMMMGGAGSGYMSARPQQQTAPPVNPFLPQQQQQQQQHYGTPNMSTQFHQQGQQQQQLQPQYQPWRG